MLQEEDDELDIFLEPFRDDMDIYSNKAIDLLMENDGISAEEAAFMQGYNEGS